MNQERPNIIFILSDQHSNYCAADTPNLDRLRARGTEFSSVYCSSPLCVPSRAGIMTGRLPSSTGVWNNVQCLRSDEATFAHSLAAAGYETVLAGRMHFILADQLHGFEKHLVGEITPTYPRKGRQKSIYGVLAGTPDQSYTSIEKSGSGRSAVQIYDTDVKDAACDFIRGWNGERPFFLLAGFYGPHCPFVASEGLYRKYYERLTDVKSFKDIGSLHPSIRRFIELRGIEHVSDEELRRVTAAYNANVEFLDTLIGEILDTAEQKLDMSNTVLIYASDHGESLGSHGLFWKSNFYRESVDVPLVFSWEGHFQKSRIIEAPVSLLDLAPTFIELGGGKVLPSYDGRSLADVLYGAEADPERYIIAELADIKGDMPSAMIRQGRFKLIKYCGEDRPLLFDLIADPAENHDLGADEEFKDVRNALMDKLHASWDEDKAMIALRNGMANASMIKEWIATVNPQISGEWSIDPAVNFLDKEM